MTSAQLLENSPARPTTATVRIAASGNNSGNTESTSRFGLHGPEDVKVSSSSYVTGSVDLARRTSASGHRRRLSSRGEPNGGTEIWDRRHTCPTVFSAAGNHTTVVPRGREEQSGRMMNDHGSTKDPEAAFLLAGSRHNRRAVYRRGRGSRRMRRAACATASSWKRGRQTRLSRCRPALRHRTAAPREVGLHYTARRRCRRLGAVPSDGPGLEQFDVCAVPARREPARPTQSDGLPS